MPRQRIWTLVGLGSAIVALLLASGQTGLTFRPSHMYDLGALTLPTGTPTPEQAAELRPPGWLSVVVTLIILATRVYRAIGVILSRSFRRKLLLRTISMLIVSMLVDLVLSARRRRNVPMACWFASVVRFVVRPRGIAV